MTTQELSRPAIHKPALRMVGMWGIGDGLHQRAIVRELMKHYQVWLDTPNFSMYHDLVAQGLRLVLRPTRLRAQAKTIERERHLFTHGAPPISAVRAMRYNKKGVEDHGSILAAMFATAGLPMPERPDFSLPIPDLWNAKARELLTTWNIGHKPLLVYRPQVLRSEWNQAQRNPDPAVYSTLFKSVRDRFFVVSIADIMPGIEWIEGPEQDADVKLHHGELDFPTMAALFEIADMVMSPAGFGPILAQAVGTPVVAVYGCRESYQNTDRAGAHLAPTLGIDIDATRLCLNGNCRLGCNKHTTLPPVLECLEAFVTENIQ